ncbi:isoleucine--tRNA ligase [Candidatus Berkelbacteria bacterium RIFCSPHIGHO2_12_FULL_36_9]|uniref:Isoleucine--tRNA ligase n=1 Tax=Candidatus Berkelbacteria bacterium RIFCSPHIGHO2_12_FULL_36_9 TaxID=1797469 RepID=A0A1F5EE35_9BACT|nr:MAG: isoleucine--tRNA ligase [Candidatus Berkelbacteria bacterium RIFCSPHIGHO2_12_FULL_36_9]
MFKPVDPKQDFVKLEHEVIGFWKKNNIINKYLKKNHDSTKKWSFLDGPITANNPMGVHHAWGRTLKDLWQRFYTMKGYKQRYQNGFDCQGLWVEVEVEKELGFKSKKDIEKYGIDKFVNKCKERVEKYSAIQTEQSKRLAEWMDFDNSYYTMSNDNNYTIWHFLKICFENGWIYKGTDSVPWCPRCGTAISQHEILTEEYKEIVHDSVYFKLPILNLPKTLHLTPYTYLLLWTTTPWTIPANIAVAIDIKKEYGIYTNGNENLIILKSRAEKILSSEYTFVESINGGDLIKSKYEAPFDDIEGVTKQLGNYKHSIVESDDLILPVSEEEGTGMVHVATGAGSEDAQLGKKHNLPIVNVIGEDAAYLEYMGYLAGKNAKKDPKIIFDILKNKDNGRYLYKIEPYKHRYPTCWRCKEELVWRNVKEWYIAMDRPSHKATGGKSSKKTFRERMIGVAKKINWIPEWGLDRELDWLNNMHDWLISKKRYWGLVLPIYECEKCGSFEVIGSYDELKQRAVSGWDKFKGNSPHRPWIDEVKIKCLKCGKLATRIKDVGNPWLDAGIVPFSTYIDPNSKKVSYLTDKKYWKEWFPVDFITESFPGQFKNWFYSLIAMSAALEDTNPFKNLLGHALVRDEKGEEMHKSNGNAIWFDEAAEKMGVDVMRFMYAKQNPVQNLNFGYGPGKEVLRGFILMLWNCYSFFVTYANIDKWKPSKSHKPYTISNKLLDKWIISRLIQIIEKVNKNLEKYDLYHSIQEIEDFVDDLSTWYLRRSRKKRDSDFYNTMYTVLLNLSLILSPFVPHIAESIYQNLKTKNDGESVHLGDWPLDITHGKLKIGQKLLTQMQEVRDVVEKAHAIRAEKGIKVRQPLSKLIIKNSNLENEELLNIIAEEVNVKKVIVDGKVKEGLLLDTQLTDELRIEGDAREIIRQIQSLRKETGLTPADKISVSYHSENAELMKVFKLQNELIAKETHSEISKSEKFNGMKKLNINKNILQLAIKKI